MTAIKHAMVQGKASQNPWAHVKQPHSIVWGLSIHRGLKTIKASQNLTLANPGKKDHS